ncbi:hypothetical protein GCM10009678_09370 [Actinomadura kijaniata]
MGDAHAETGSLAADVANGSHGKLQVGVGALNLERPVRRPCMTLGPGEALTDRRPGRGAWIRLADPAPGMRIGLRIHP